MIDSDAGRAGQSPVASGERLYKGNCSACHSIDGSSGTGPSFKDLVGRTEHLVGGVEIDVDYAYIHDSIRYPGRQIVDGYQTKCLPLII